jgi:hypothetical protein
VVDRWLEREVARGLQGLLALRLVGSPPEDSIELTLDVWLAAIESMSVNWNEQLDAERVRRAFRTLYRTCDRWPPPKLFLDNLGNRDPPKALPPPQISEEQRKKNVASLREMMMKLGREKSISGSKKE